MGYNSSKYCSKKCANAAYYKHQRETNPSYCIVCGQLISNIKYRKYCSEECKKKGIQMNNKKFYENLRKEKEKRQKKNAMVLSEISRLAREEGLTYGQYVLKHGL
jgi:predicted nucleic acid-binding Zn ribbon protein